MWEYEEKPGMDLRDYFAGQALMGLLADSENLSSNAKNAEIAYSVADAMLAEREKKKGRSDD